MVFRTAGATATLLICLAGTGGQSSAQYYPPSQAYPPQAYRPSHEYTPRQPLPPMADEEDAPPLNAPVMQAPLPPVGGGPQGNEPPTGTRYGTPALPPSSGGQPYPAVQPPQGYEAAGTALTMVCQAPSRPAQLARPSRTQSGATRCGRRSRLVPFKRGRDQLIRG